MYMKFRQTDTPMQAAAKAGFSPASGYRVEDDPRLPSQKQVKRGRRRPDPLAAVWDSWVISAPNGTFACSVEGGWAERCARGSNPRRDKAMIGPL